MLPRPHVLVLAAAWALCSPPAVPAQSTAAAPVPAESALSTRINAILSTPAAARAHWGIAVTALDGTPLYSLDDGKLFRPASTAKLFTTAAAMALLGPDHRFITGLYGDLDPATGVVQGDLTLVGGGDPSLGTEDLPYLPAREHQVTEEPPAGATILEEFTTALTSAGIKQITGNLLGDDSLFEAPAVPEGWAEEDLLWGYGALPSALSFGDNEIRLTVTPKPPGPVPGKPAAWTGTLLTSTELFPYLHVENQVLTIAADKDHPDVVDARNLPGASGGVQLFGRLSPGAPAQHETIALQDPAAYAAKALRTLLQQHGVLLKGEAKALHHPLHTEAHAFLHEVRSEDPRPETPAGVPQGEALDCLSTPRSGHLIAQHTSPPLAQDITYTLKTSANLHAELLLHHLGLLRPSCGGVTTLEGARVLRSWLEHIGLAADDFMLYDGSGLSTKDLVTPRAEAQLLAYAARQPWFPQWKTALPIGGIDGTLAARFTAPPLKGHLYAKTGTLGETRALAGFVQGASGQERIVTVFVDDHLPGNSADRQAMDAIVAAIAELN